MGDGGWRGLAPPVLFHGRAEPVRGETLSLPD